MRASVTDSIVTWLVGDSGEGYPELGDAHVVVQWCVNSSGGEGGTTAPGVAAGPRRSDARPWNSAGSRKYKDTNH